MAEQSQPPLTTATSGSGSGEPPVMIFTRSAYFDTSQVSAVKEKKAETTEAAAAATIPASTRVSSGAGNDSGLESLMAHAQAEIDRRRKDERASIFDEDDAAAADEYKSGLSARPTAVPLLGAMPTALTREERKLAGGGSGKSQELVFDTESGAFRTKVKQGELELDALMLKYQSPPLAWHLSVSDRAKLRTFITLVAGMSKQKAVNLYSDVGYDRSLMKDLTGDSVGTQTAASKRATRPVPFQSSSVDIDEQLKVSQRQRERQLVAAAGGGGGGGGAAAAAREPVPVSYSAVQDTVREMADAYEDEDVDSPIFIQPTVFAALTEAAVCVQMITGRSDFSARDVAVCNSSEAQVIMAKLVVARMRDQDIQMPTQYVGITAQAEQLRAQQILECMIGNLHKRQLL